MQKLMVAGAALALAVLALAAAAPSYAVTVVIGGLAGECFSLAKAGKHDAHALDVCTRALNSDPLGQHDLAGTHVNRGAMELLRDDNEAARADFEEAIRIFPTLGEAHVGLGAYLVRLERWTDADAEITKGLDLGSEEPEKGYYLRGIARWAQDDFKGAYFDFKKASELKPGWDLPRQQLTHFKVEPAQ